MKYMNEILFEGVRKENGEKVVGCLINNMFFLASRGTVSAKLQPVPYIIPNTIDYDCWEDIAEVADEYEVIPDSVRQLTFLD